MGSEMCIRDRRLIEKPGLPMRLEGIALSMQADRTAEAIAWVYKAATTIQHEELQKLAVKKMRVLYPLTPLSLLIVATIVGGGNSLEQQSRDPILPTIEYSIAESYFLLVEHHGSQLAQVLRGNLALRMAVHKRLANNPHFGFQRVE